MNENLNPELPAENLPETPQNEIVNETEIDSSPVQLEITPPETSLVKTSSLTKEEVIEKLKNIAGQRNVPPRAEVEALKQAYYKIRSSENEVQKTAFVEAGNEVESFVPSVDASEDVVKTFLNEIKEKRVNQLKEEENLKEGNYTKKSDVIEKIKGLTESSEDFNKLYKEFKDLQQSWSSIGHVPQAKEKDLWRLYQIYTEKFYDLIKINNEFRDYDFKKNLELKVVIIDAVEKLADESDVISAFHQLQNFHDQWREIGPVNKELREEIWAKFKEASANINKKYQSHFEGLKEKEEDNLSQKTEIIENLKTIDYAQLTSFKSWDEKSSEVIELQIKWKTIGFVPRKMNTAVFDEFRKLCDEFFAKKSDFFKGVKDEMEVNLQKKRELCDRANALKDSVEWRKTTDEMISIQKEWKTIGPVSRKHSDAIWREFVTACDYFFEQKKKKNESSHKTEENDNLIAKKAIIEQIKALDESIAPAEAIAKVKELSEEWHQIGYVPFKEKDKIYKEFHEAVDVIYDRLKIDKAERRMESFKSNMKDISKGDNAQRSLYKERDYLMHQYNKLKSDVQTYENNISFLSISSKGGNSLLKDVNHKIENLKGEMDLIAKKIELLDEKMKDI